MKTKTEIQEWIKQLERIMKSGSTVESRIAWLEVHLLRRIVEDGIVGWPSVTDDLRGTADLIEQEMSQLRRGLKPC